MAEELFISRLKELRENAGYSQPEIAKMLGVDKQTISQYELGKRRPSYEMLFSLCDIFNVSTDYFLKKDNVSPRLLTSDELTLIDDYRKGSVIIDASADELTLLDGYRHLSDKGRVKLQDRLEELALLEEKGEQTSSDTLVS